MTITIQDVARKAVELADANPEHIYQPETDGEGTSLGCRYVHRDHVTEQPNGYGCLFGQALVGLGVKPSDIPEMLNIGVVLRDLGIATEDDDTYPLTSAQGRQDAREPWHIAIEPVREYLAGQEAA